MLGAVETMRCGAAAFIDNAAGKAAAITRRSLRVTM
jgi:hypothetical protein